MSQLDNLLNERMKKGKNSAKVTALAQQSADGSRTGFSGIFGVAQLSTQEKHLIKDILETYAYRQSDIEGDLESLSTLSSEIKAISNQAALLHGERISRAREILQNYEEGAFTSWMVAAYGNRQTPYNFLQYYEFYTNIPKTLHPQIELMPRQAVYTLASREGAIEDKEHIVASYNGETKQELLEIIRETFPLDSSDKRKKSRGEALIKSLDNICIGVERLQTQLTKRQKRIILELTETIQEVLE